MKQTLERILTRVQKPARYTGGEYLATIKPLDEVDIRAALCFPDTYEIGMSNLGLRILYAALNRMEGVWCERLFAPWTDMEAELRAASLPLFALESGDAVRDFDLLGFSIGYELSYSNVLNVLSLSGLPLRSSEREALTPIILAGGTCSYNPEPLAPFVDVFSIGEGEDALPELVDLLRVAKREDWSKPRFLEAAAQLPGFYVPSLYEHQYAEDGTLAQIIPLGTAPKTVTKRLMRDMDTALFPIDTMVPSTEIVQDRVMLELFRGCIRGCRFCQAGFIYRPVRNRDPKLLAQQGIEACKASGYQEMTLASLSSSDYPALLPLCDELLEWSIPQQVSLSLPSLRADNFSMQLMARLSAGGRKSGLTFAPEAGSQRLRDAINKNLSEEDLLNSCRTAFSGGWNAVKLYFMLGLPTETDEDILGIAELAGKVHQLWRDVTPNRARGVRITVSTSCFVPKSHTPFQWEPQVEQGEYLRRVNLLRSAIRNRSITYNWHDPETSFLEAVFSRGDRRLADVLEAAHLRGARFDSWSEHFSLPRWLESFEACGVDPSFYANRPRAQTELLPWQTISDGVRNAYLWDEREACFAGSVTPDCRTQCGQCGANRFCEGGVCHG